MCRILELIIRNYKQQNIHRTEENRGSLIEEIESDEKRTFEEEEAGESEAFFQPTGSVSNGVYMYQIWSNTPNIECPCMAIF